MITSLLVATALAVQPVSVVTQEEQSSYVQVCSVAADVAVQTRDPNQYASVIAEFAVRAGLSEEEASHLYAVCGGYLQGIQRVLRLLSENRPRT